jgi:hypothetical protein
MMDSQEQLEFRRKMFRATTQLRVVQPLKRRMDGGWQWGKRKTNPERLLLRSRQRKIPKGKM